LAEGFPAWRGVRIGALLPRWRTHRADCHRGRTRREPATLEEEEVEGAGERCVTFGRGSGVGGRRACRPRAVVDARSHSCSAGAHRTEAACNRTRDASRASFAVRRRRQLMSRRRTLRWHVRWRRAIVWRSGRPSAGAATRAIGRVSHDGPPRGT
jgi:hypothetical protein